MADADSTKSGRRVRFKQVKGFPGYFVGTDGTVWTTRYRYYKKGTASQLAPPAITYRCDGPWRKMAGGLRRGYPRVTLARDGRDYTFGVHQLVLRAFVGPEPPGMEARHLNGVRSDARLDNLCWGTSKENEEDKARHGTKLLGSRCNASKLTEGQVAVIKARLRAGGNRVWMAREYGISLATLYRILQNKYWKHILPAAAQAEALARGAEKPKEE